MTVVVSNNLHRTLKGRSTVAVSIMFDSHLRHSFWNCLRRSAILKRNMSSSTGRMLNMKYGTILISYLHEEERTRIQRGSLLHLSHSHLLRKPLICRHFSQSKESNKESNSGAENEMKGEHESSKTENVKRENSSGVGAFARFKEMVNTFWTGCKQLLWIDARKAWATKKKLRRHDYDLTILTREELRHMRQTQKDIIKSLPVALLFCIPFIGYFAPVIGYLFPKRLLSHQFWDIEQSKKFAFEDHTRRSQYYRPLVQEVGWSSRELENQDLFQLCIKAIDGNHIENEEILKQRDVFNDELMTIKKMPRFHLVKLCKTWLLPVKWYVPSRVLREFLSYRIKQIIEDDAAIRRDGLGILSDLCIRQACHARGLDKYSFDIPVMQQWLEEWLQLTNMLTEKDSSFLAHCAAIKTMNFNQAEKKNEIIEENSPHI